MSGGVAVSEQLDVLGSRIEGARAAGFEHVAELLENARERVLGSVPGEGAAVLDELEAAPPELTGSRAPHGERIAEPGPWDLRGEPEPWQDVEEWRDPVTGLPKRPGYCGAWTVAGVVEADGRGPRRLVVARVDCGRWVCPKCAPRRAAKVRRALTRAVLRHKLNRFVTLTISPNRIPPGADPHRFIQKSWQRFRARVRRELGVSLCYVMVVEHHRSGMPHLHLLVDRFLPWRQARAWWEDATRPSRERYLPGQARAGFVYAGSTGFWISHVDEQRAARYVVKYLAKEVYAAGPSAPVKFRRVSASRGIRLVPARVSRGFVVLREGIARVASWLWSRGLLVVAEVDRRGFLLAASARPFPLEELEVVFGDRGPPADAYGEASA